MKDNNLKENLDIYNYLVDIIKHKKVQEMKNFVQHGTVSTFEHCFSVAKSCSKFANFFKLNVNFNELIIGAFLHDFYLYDWHKNSPKDNLHAFSHPYLAAENTRKFFNVNSNILNIIKTHMWPINFFKVPKSKEAWVVCLCDKYVSLIETFKGKLNKWI